MGISIDPLTEYIWDWKCGNLRSFGEPQPTPLPPPGTFNFLGNTRFLQLLLLHLAHDHACLKLCLPHMSFQLKYATPTYPGFQVLMREIGSFHCWVHWGTLRSGVQLHPAHCPNTRSEAGKATQSATEELLAHETTAVPDKRSQFVFLRCPAKFEQNYIMSKEGLLHPRLDQHVTKRHCCHLSYL